MKKYYAEHREEQAAYYAAHREERAVHNAAHREEKAVYNAVYNTAHHEEIAVQQAAHYAEHPERTIWHNMIRRCTNPQHKSWATYGGAGVKVCRRWLTYANFISDMGKRPSPKHSLSRLADAGDYKKGNVVWGTRAHQELQKRIKRQRRAA